MGHAFPDPTLGNFLVAGDSVNFTGSYSPSGTGAALCGPFTDTISASGQDSTGLTVFNTDACIDPTTGTSTGPRPPVTATCNVCNNPCVAVTKNCGPASIALGQSYMVSGVVTNCGNVPLTNVVVIDTITDAAGNKTSVTNFISGLLDTNGTLAVPTQTITPTLCGPNQDQFSVTAQDICTGATVGPSTSQTCTTVVICVPCIGVSKLIACGPCGSNPGSLSYGPSATGVAGTNNPAFCYQIVVTNCSTSVTLTNVQVSDPTIGLTITLPTNLPPATATAPIFQGASFGVGTVTNTVIATGQSQATGDTVTTNASAVAIVVPASVACKVDLSSTFFTNSSPSCEVTLPFGTTNAPITITLTITNTGQADLDVNIIGGNVLNAAVFDCNLLTPITFGTVFVPAGVTTNFVLGCVEVSCPGTNITVVVQGTAVASKSIPCVLDINGNTITTAPSQCSQCVDCLPPTVVVQCRVTGGGTLQPGATDTNCVTLTTVLSDDEQCAGTVVDHISHGGQLGAPFNQKDCGQVLGDPCIRGQWQHNRHYQGTGNPQDVINVDFHTYNANVGPLKGVFDTLECACLGCCSGGVFIGSATNNALCNPGDHKICGPEPRPAPANAIIFTGLGVFSPANCGNSGKNQPDRWFVFRVYIEDRSEPGGLFPKGGTEPADVYCFQAWDTGMQVVKHSDASTVATAFRSCLGADSCAFIQSISTSAPTGVPPGTLPNPTVVCNGQAMTADINDCGPLYSGNHQIHPSTGATCTTTTPLTFIP
jgi:hypothetical protein